MFIIPNKNEIKMLPENKARGSPYIDSISPASFFSNNEIEISQRILTIPNYYRHFNPILKNSYINVSEIDSEYFERCEELTVPNESFYIIKKKNLLPFDTFQNIFYKTNIKNKKNIKTARKYVLTIINTYKHLLNTIKIMENSKLVNLDFHPSTLIFNNNLPVLNDLSMFFHITTLNEERKSKLFSNYNPKNVFLPPEAQVLCYLNQNDAESLSISDIEDITNNYIKSLTSLNYLKKDLIEGYGCCLHFSLQTFVNKAKCDIFNEVIMKSNTWNNYGLSILFIVLLRDISNKTPIFSSNPFILEICQLLFKNISPNIEERISIDKNISFFNDILCNTDKTVFLSLINGS